jgi:UDP-N-acetylglucosamine 1-carboxyvinyltransferase
MAIDEASIVLEMPGTPRAVNVETAPYPRFPTDLHPQLAALLSLANGASTIRETVFERRFAYASELSKMGASTVQDGTTLRIEGGGRLRGATVEAPDIRGGAALVLAGLAAEGRTVVTGLDHIDRGHDDLAGKLAKVGACIERRDDAT